MHHTEKDIEVFINKIITNNPNNTRVIHMQYFEKEIIITFEVPPENAE